MPILSLSALMRRMIDPILTPFALIHLAVLLCLVFWGCRRIGLPLRDWPFAAAALLWGTLVLAAHVSGVFKSLGDLAVYVPATFLSAFVMVGMAWASFRSGVGAGGALVSPRPLLFSAPASPKLRKFLWYFLACSLGFAALSSAALVMGVYPDNADSMIYRLPRAFWYSSGGSFLHPFDAADKRLTFYPLDGVALYIPMVLYGLPGTAHGLPSLAAWGMVAYSSYRFARELGSERLLALFAAWLVAMTPGVLAQATSTNDEILAAAAMLGGLYSAWRWLTDGRRGYFFLAVLAVSISIGTKLHVVFLSPVIAALSVIMLWRAFKDRSLPAKWWEAIGWKTAVLAALAFLMMFPPFLLYNYLSTGRWYFLGDFAGDVFNLTASVKGGLQNLLIYLSQMMISPFADLNSWPVANDRQKFNNVLNSIFYPLISGVINHAPSFYHMNYRFVGVVLPVSVRFLEFSLWAGFVWLLWPLQAAGAFRQRFVLRPLFLLLALTPPIWILTWSFSTLYMEGTATYFTYYLICAAPAAAMAFAPIGRNSLNELRWATIGLVTLTSLTICVNLLMFSGFRALPDLFYARKLPFDWLVAEDAVVSEIRRADRVRVIMSHEKTPFFAYMHWNPRAKFYSPYPMPALPDYQDVLQIMPVSSYYMYGFMPIRIPDKKTTGMTFLGVVRAIGTEAIFATGNGTEKRFPKDRSEYIILQASISPLADGQGQYAVSMAEGVAGLNKDDGLEFAFKVVRHPNYSPAPEVVFSRDWDSKTGFGVVLGRDKIPGNYYMEIAVRSALSHVEVAKATYSINGQGAWLPDLGEY